MRTIAHSYLHLIAAALISRNKQIFAKPAGDVAYVDEDGYLLVCRNLHLDEKISRAPSLPGPPPYLSMHVTEEISIGGDRSGGNNNADTDVSFLLDKSGSSHNRLDPSVDLRLHYHSNHDPYVKLLGIDYTTDGAGFRIGSFNEKQEVPAIDANNPIVTYHSTDGDGYQQFIMTIPPESYVNANDAPWTDMRRMAFTYGIMQPKPSVQNVEVKIKLVQLCSRQPPPHFCSEETVDSYKEKCHQCQCETCHNCGCSPAAPWGNCDAHGKCDHDGCWCHPACKCCSDCEGYSCNCKDCCDTSSLAGCSLGSSVRTDSVSPPDGIASISNEIKVVGDGFYANGPDVTCMLGKDGPKVRGRVEDSTSVVCTVPPKDMNGTSSLEVPVLVSLDGIQFTEPSNATFTYLHCPDGCSKTCPATSCLCPKHYYGPDCSLKCENCDHGSCGSGTGSCSCDVGWTGDRCDIECPGGYTNPCSDSGSCFASPNGTAALCFCSSGFWGEACQYDCPKDSSGNVCGNAGSCNKGTGECICNPGHFGDSCTSACPGLADLGRACSGNGICCTGKGAAAMYSQCDDKQVGSCACDAGRGGQSCSDSYCFNSCYGHGKCDTQGKCSCEEGYSGQFCSLLTGQNASLSYFSFLESSHLVNEQVGLVSVDVMRFGNLDGEVSIMYETNDLTAKAEEDYIAKSERLYWSSMDGSKRRINITVLKNDWPEGEESFEISLKDPLPEGASEVGSTQSTIVRIAEKAEKMPTRSVVARVVLRILKPWSAVQPGKKGGDSLKASFKDATVTATRIDSERVYLHTIDPAADDRVMLTFDILPSESTDAKSVRDAADAFVSAVADSGSVMYSTSMRQFCPIDVSFQPEIRMVAFDRTGEEELSTSSAVITFFLALFMVAAALLYIFREKATEMLLKSLAMRKFHSLRGTPDHDLSFEEDYGTGSSGYSERAVARYQVDDLQEGFKKKVLHIELT